MINTKMKKKGDLGYQRAVSFLKRQEGQYFTPLDPLSDHGSALYRLSSRKRFRPVANIEEGRFSIALIHMILTDTFTVLHW